MHHLVQSIDAALAANNHYAALALALTIPDIGGWIKDPSAGSRARCIAWFDRYMKPAYTRPATANRAEHIFLTGADFYALRCAYLHEGRDEIVDQQAQQVLERFQFVVPPQGWAVHCNQVNNTLQLQVDVFCREVVRSVEALMLEIASDPAAVGRMAQLLLIRDVNGRPL